MKTGCHHSKSIISLTGLILILLLFITGGGDFIIFKLVKNSIEHEVKKKINQGICDDELTMIILSKETEKHIHWTEFHKEFEYNGEMYDVVKSIQKGSLTYMYCLNDKKEASFVSAFYFNLRLRIQKIMHSYQIMFTVPVNALYYIPHYSYQIQVSEMMKISSATLKVLSPPPEIFHF